jgi:uncharacterized protein YlxW (UPF0749 family)
MSKLINNDNLNKLAKALDARHKTQLEKEKSRAETRENELQNEINKIKDSINSGGGGSENYQFHYNEETEEITISGLTISYDEESENLQIGGIN